MDFLTSTWFLSAVGGGVVGFIAPGLWIRAKAKFLAALARRIQ